MIVSMDASLEIRIADDSASLAEIAAHEIVSVARAAVAARGRFTVALAGGSTPRATYRRLAQPPLAAQMPWDRTLVFFGDERGVPPNHEDSNYGMAHAACRSHPSACSGFGAKAPTRTRWPPTTRGLWARPSAFAAERCRDSI
jgi:6-phosphogluconolactonase/glucosamine-6-phosphate isomerase/deaminase